MAVTASTLLPKQHGRKRRYYTADEVSAHNAGDDAWVSIFGRVFDLTHLIADHRGVLTAAIVANAGRDLSHWFDAATQDVKRRYDADRDVFAPYVPMGRFLHVPPAAPSADHATDFGVAWWNDAQFIIGKLSLKVRKLRVVNTLTAQSDVLHVCCEETLEEIQTRYSEFNAHAKSYTWKQLTAENGFEAMDMTNTLEECGLLDESAEFERLGIDEDAHVATVHVYFNDDLTYS